MIVSVTDGHGGTVDQQLSVTVHNVDDGGNQLPIITSEATASIAENTTDAIVVAARDPDSGRGASLTFALSGPDAAFFETSWFLIYRSQQVSFRTAPDFEHPDDADGDNVYNFTVTVTDAAGGFTEQDVAITVTDVVEQDTQVPVFTSPSQSFIRTDNARLPVSWTPVDGAYRYQVWYSQAGTNESSYIREFTDAASFTPAADLPIGRYAIRVRVYNNDGTTGKWAQSVTIQVQARPEILAPELHQATRRPTLSWSPVNGAAEYDLWINNATTGVSQVIRETVAGTSFQPTADLSFGQYRVWVRAVDSSGLASTWSGTQRFNVSPTAVALPVSTFDQTPTLRWTTDTGNIQYEIYVRTGDGTIVRESGLTSDSWTSTSNLSTGRTVWWIRPTINGRIRQWSDR